jgi:hypothetical protein
VQLDLQLVLQLVLQREVLLPVQSPDHRPHQLLKHQPLLARAVKQQTHSSAWLRPKVDRHHDPLRVDPQPGSILFQ